MRRLVERRSWSGIVGQVCRSNYAFTSKRVHVVLKLIGRVLDKIGRPGTVGCLRPCALYISAQVADGAFQHLTCTPLSCRQTATLSTVLAIGTSAVVLCVPARRDNDANVAA